MAGIKVVRISGILLLKTLRSNNPNMKFLNLILVFGISLLGGSGVQVFDSSDSLINQQQPIIFPSPASCNPLSNPYDTIVVPVSNTQANSLTGIVFEVLHNSIGQTLEISTGLIIAAGGQNQTAWP